MWTVQFDPLIAAGVVVATAMTDAVYVAFTGAANPRTDGGEQHIKPPAFTGGDLE
jgi:hypothetical protein